MMEFDVSFPFHINEHANIFDAVPERFVRADYSRFNRNFWVDFFTRSFSGESPAERVEGFKRELEFIGTYGEEVIVVDHGDHIVLLTTYDDWAVMDKLAGTGFLKLFDSYTKHRGDYEF